MHRACRFARAFAALGILVIGACGDAGTEPAPPPPPAPVAPVAVGTIPAQTVAAGETAEVDVSPYFSDTDGEVLTYTASSSNATIATVTVSGSSVVVVALARGVVTVTVAARDAHGLIAQQRFQVTVPNRAPEAKGEIPAQTVFAGQTASLDASAYFRDADGDRLTYTAASSNPEVATVTVAAATLTIRAAAVGVATVTVTASDPGGASVQQTIGVTVPNRAPEAVGTIANRTVATGQSKTLDVVSYFNDPDGGALTYTASSSAAAVVSVSMSASTLTLVGVAEGTTTVTVTATDPDGLTAAQGFQVTVETPNRAPEAVGTIPAQTLTTGQTATVDVASYFRDPDGDALSYTAASSNAAIATATMSGTSVEVVAVSAGFTTVTVTATDPGRLSTTSSFDVTVESTPGGFQIDLIFATPVTRTQEAAFVRAAARWMTVLAPTDLPDLGPRTRDCGDDPRFERYAAIDDVMIVAVVEEIDGPGGTLAAAAPCWIRVASGLPSYGRMRFDAADIDEYERIGGLEELVLHEMGHVLGIGTFIWEDFGLLRDPASETEAPDTHFSGRLAIDAFNEAGGTDYEGAKVPVENTGGPGTRNGHWRESVLNTELMTGWSEEGVPEPLSAITIQSLADMGYAVDLTAADPYRLPDADAARARKPARLIPYGDDIWRGPIIVADRDGRIVRVIPGSRGERSR